MANIKSNTDYMIEISNQVSCPLSGVYAVMDTKSKEMRRNYGDNYYAIGPYFKCYTDKIFEEKTPPKKLDTFLKN